MTFEEFWKENYGSEFGTSEPYYGIASYAYEKGQENCNCVYTDNSYVIHKLEKENAELKEKNKALELYADLAYGKVDEVKGQITKAKDLIRNLLRVTWDEGWNYSLDWKVKAEQFLNGEVEK